MHALIALVAVQLTFTAIAIPAHISVRCRLAEVEAKLPRNYTVEDLRAAAAAEHNKLSDRVAELEVVRQ